MTVAGETTITLDGLDWEALKSESCRGLKIEIDAGISMADMTIHKDEDPLKTCYEFPKEPSSDYKYAMFLKQADGAVVPFISKDGETASLAAVYIIDGERVNPGWLAYAMEVGGSVSYDEYEEMWKEQARRVLEAEVEK